MLTSTPAGAAASAVIMQQWSKSRYNNTNTAAGAAASAVIMQQRSTIRYNNTNTQQEQQRQPSSCSIGAPADITIPMLQQTTSLSQTAINSWPNLWI